MTYEEAVANHRWNVPARYNIARDVCDKHPPDKLAMIWEDYRGNEREVRWGELQELSNRFANVLRARGIERGDRVAVVLPPTPETAAVFFGTWKVGGILLSMSVLYGDEGIAHRLRDSQAKLLVTDAADRDRFEDAPVGDVMVLDADTFKDGSDRFEIVDTAADDPGQLYYSSGTTGLAKGILHAHRYLLGHEEFVYCHDVRDGELFHGMGSGRGRRASRRCWARGALARRSSSSSARAASTQSSSSRCSPSAASRTCSRRRRRCAR